MESVQVWLRFYLAHNGLYTVFTAIVITLNESIFSCIVKDGSEMANMLEMEQESVYTSNDANEDEQDCKGHNAEVFHDGL